MVLPLQLTHNFTDAIHWSSRQNSELQLYSAVLKRLLKRLQRL